MPDDETHILIGSGFNFALSSLCEDVEIKFSYKDILNKVKENVRNKKDLCKFLDQGEIAKEDKIQDIEKLLWILSRSKICLKYDDGVYAKMNDGWEKKIGKHIKLLKTEVINVMTDSNFHPKWKSIFENHDDYVSNCAENLKQFKRIYTINYDLILYWLLCHKGLIKESGKGKNKMVSNGRFTDGFSKKTSDNNINEFRSLSNHPNIFFLHGAIHILSKDRSAYKIIRGDSTDPLSDIRKNLLKKSKEYENCLVFNSSSAEKKIDIYGNDCKR